jgi:hypothetical protein
MMATKIKIIMTFKGIKGDTLNKLSILLLKMWKYGKRNNANSVAFFFCFFLGSKVVTSH